MTKFDMAEFVADIHRAAEERDLTVQRLDLRGEVDFIQHRTGIEISLRSILISGGTIRLLFAAPDDRQAPR